MKKEILTLFMSGCSVILAAQTTGTVVDENKQPLPAAYSLAPTLLCPPIDA